MIVNETWTLNDQYFVFYIQNRARATHTSFWGVFCAHTGLGAKSVFGPFCPNIVSPC